MGDRSGDLYTTIGTYTGIQYTVRRISRVKTSIYIYRIRFSGQNSFMYYRAICVYVCVCVCGSTSYLIKAIRYKFGVSTSGVLSRWK